MPRGDDIQHVQQSIEDLQARVQNQSGQLEALSEAQRRTSDQLSEFMRTQREAQQAQQRSHEHLSELITGLSFQVMQMKERPRDTGGQGGSSSSNGGNTFSRLSRVDFPDLMEKMFKAGSISVSNFLRSMLFQEIGR